MANTTSAKKEVRKNIKRYAQNKSAKSKVRTILKKAEEALLANNANHEEVLKLIRDFESSAMKLAKKNVINKIAVSRKVSKLVLKMKKKFEAK